jgi:uncharacterized protein YjiS (DUF1127 family)
MPSAPTTWRARIVCSPRLRHYPHLGAGLRLLHPGRRNAAVDDAAQGCQSPGEDSFRDVLRQHQQVGVLAGEGVEGKREQGAIAVADAEAREFQSVCSQLVRNADRLENLERMRVDHRRPRGVVAFRQLVDQHMADAGLLQGDREREAGRACADDQHVRFGSEHGSLHKSTCA